MYRKTNNNSAGFDSKQKKTKNTFKSNNHAPKQHIISSTSSSSFYNNHSHKNTSSSSSSCSSNKVIHQNIKMYVNNLYNNSSSDFMPLSKTKSSDSTRSCTSSSDSIQSSCSNKNELSNVMGMNNFNSKTTTSNTTTTVASPVPGPYSLDFLHYVGEQVSSGRTNFSGYKSNDDSNNNTSIQKNHKTMTDSTAVPVSLKHNSNSSLNNQHYFIDSTQHTNSNHTNSNVNNNSNNHHYRFNQHNYHHNNNYHTFNRNFNPHGNHQGKQRNWSNNINPGLCNGGWQSKTNKNFNNNSNNTKNITTNQNPSKTVLYSRSNRVINSRSPTPSPKSESPPIEITPNGTQNISTNINIGNHKVNNRQIDDMVGYNINAIQHTNGNSNFNGFDTDSSMLYSINGHNNNSHNGNGPHIIELPVSLSQISDEPFRGYYTFYGSHQNLNQPYEPNFMHKHNYSSSSSDTGLNFVTDHLDGFDSGNINKKKNSPVVNHPLSAITTGKFNRTGKKLNNSGYTIKGASSEFIHTPPDRFLAKSHLIQTKVPHKDLIVGSEWDMISQNIWDRFICAQQTEETFKRKMYLWRYLFLCIKKAFPRYGLYLVGSTITGFGTDNSDVDMCLVTRYITHNDPRIEALFYLTELKNYLMNTSGIFENFHLIQAKVPILRFKDNFNALEVDLNFNNCVGIRNTHLLYCYQQMDWRLKPLAVIVKLWAQFHHINNAKNMTISSYSLVLMVIHYLQVGVSPPVLPCLHALYPDKFQKILDLSNIDMIESMKSYTSDNRQTMGELFYGFLEYYSHFDYSQYAISVRTASILPIEECRQARSYKNDPHQWKQLCIEEPFDLTNTARSVYDGEIFDKIKNVFVTSYKVLHETMDLNSVFTTVFLQTNAFSSISSSSTSTSISGNPMTSILSMPSSISSSPSIAINAGTGCL